MIRKEQLQGQEDRWEREMWEALRKKKGFGPLTPEEAEAAYNVAPDIPLSEDQINSIVRAATSGKPRLAGEPAAE